jgi:hypothetical protein
MKSKINKTSTKRSRQKIEIKRIGTIIKLLTTKMVKL